MKIKYTVYRKNVLNKNKILSNSIMHLCIISQLYFLSHMPTKWALCTVIKVTCIAFNMNMILRLKKV